MLVDGKDVMVFWIRKVFEYEIVVILGGYILVLILVGKIIY